MTPPRTAALNALLLVMLLAISFDGVSQAPTAYGVSPATLDVADAQPGQRYARSVLLQNQLDSASTITIERQGVTGAWTATDPTDGFTVPARTNRVINLSIEVPATAAGANTGLLRFVTEQKGSPDGSGAGIRFAVAVWINVTLAGAPRQGIAWGDFHADDVGPDDHPRATVGATNVGNVRQTVRLRGEVLAFDGGTVLANAAVERTIDPGQTVSVPVLSTAPLPGGQYRFHVVSLEPEGFDATDDFKVHFATGLPLDGLLRALRHAPRVQAGTALPITALFENPTSLPLDGARFQGEVLRNGQVVTQLASPTRPLAAHETANLTAEWTPRAPGIYTIRGHVEYDGYVTPRVESVVSVTPDPESGAAAFYVFAALGLAVLAVAVVVLIRSRR